MREIKFRAWRKEDGKMFGPNSNIIMDLGGLVYWQFGYNEPMPQFRKEYDLEQFTGLKDKNGTEIYEGDILGDVFGSLYVAWCEKCVAFALVNKEFGCFACEGEVNWCEVINHDNLIVEGNIHENPELLE